MLRMKNIILSNFRNPPSFKCETHSVKSPLSPSSISQHSISPFPIITSKILLTPPPSLPHPHTHSLTELELPAVSENIILDNLPIFQNNGFDFVNNLRAPPTKRIALSKIPFSKSTQFDKGDVEELIFMLEDCDPIQARGCRPTKIRSMLASRACRKSVMIGSGLGGGDMTKIIHHMGTMDQPWNCPHGRPTIRHLFNTNLLPDVPAPQSSRTRTTMT